MPAALSQADQYLLDAIRRGAPEAWAQLVDRYQGRLLAFACRNLHNHAADAEDLVQETFLGFLQGLANFRAEASLETYLFLILRRRVVNHLRGTRLAACQLQGGSDDDDSSGPAEQQLPAPDLTASTYARRDEQTRIERSALAEALSELIDDLKQQRDFARLKVIELLFYAQARNKDIARLTGADVKAVALMKHRWLKRLRETVAGRLAGADLSDLEAGRADSLLTDIWETRRLSCPKRSTIGGYVLGTLDPAWHDYVDFHVQRLGCRCCAANLQDFRCDQADPAPALRQRLMESTAGFFRASRA